MLRAAVSEPPLPLAMQSHAHSGSAREGKSRRQDAFPRLFCFTVIGVASETALVAHQFRTSTGVFACDASAIFSNASSIPGLPASLPLIAAIKGNIAVQRDSQWGSYANSQLFIQLWRHFDSSLQHVFRSFEWIIKVDPDTVLLPSLLRILLGDLETETKGPDRRATGLRPHRDAINARHVPGWIGGPLETYSSAGMKLLTQHIHQCAEWCDASSDWGKAEDVWLTCCTDILRQNHLIRTCINARLLHWYGESMPQAANGSKGFKEEEIRRSCTDRLVAAYHPQKTVDHYKRCSRSGDALLSRSVGGSIESGSLKWNCL